MIKTKRYFAATALGLLTALFCASCGFDDGYPQEEIVVGKNDVRIAFALSLQNVATRATDDSWADYDPKDAGSDYDNAINASTLRVFICDADGNVVGNVENIVASSNDDGTQIYAITGTWNNAADNVQKAKKIMVFANCNEFDTSAEAMEALSFNRQNTANYIPMWGITSIESLQLGKSNNVGTIDLLRSVAKVSISLAEGMVERGYSLGGASIANLNQMGYVLPKTYNAVDATKNIMFADSFRPYYSWMADATFYKYGDNGLVVYVPEYDNHSITQLKSIVRLTLMRDGTEEGVYTLQFCQYANGEAVDNTDYDIQRNHLYEYEVGKADDGLLVKLSVVEWNERRHDPIIM